MRASVATRFPGFYSLGKEGPFVGHCSKEEQQALHAHKAPAAPAPSLLRQQPDQFLSTLASVCGGMCSENKWAICLTVTWPFIAFLKAGAAADRGD